MNNKTDKDASTCRAHYVEIRMTPTGYAEACVLCGAELGGVAFVVEQLTSSTI